MNKEFHLFVPQNEKENSISVKVRAVPASPSLLRTSDAVQTLSAGCHWAETQMKCYFAGYF